MGHIGVKSLKGAVEGIATEDLSYPNCLTCAQANIKRTPFPKKSDHRSQTLIQRIHCDICGPLPHCYGNFSYYILFIDDFSRYISIFFMKSKDEALERYKEYRTFVERFTKEKTCILRVDNAPELVHGKMKDFCVSEGISYEKTIPHSPSQNGVAERTNLTVCSMARAMLIDADLGDYFWPFATQAAVHIKNRVTHSSLPPNKTPFEFWHKYKPNLSHLRLFGSPCTSRVLPHSATKFSPRGESGRFLGYAKDAKGYLVWIPGPNGQGGNVKPRRDVTFHDTYTRLDVSRNDDDRSPLWDDVEFPEHLITPYVLDT
jgi:Integrase core domain